jgi:2-polyprenyl-3-methyl-5-hydroxy-6-metoxy-1,4-benzoquinol methylase
MLPKANDRRERARRSRCRFCGTPLEHTFVDLGVSPLANSYLRAEDLYKMEPFYPLHVYVCGECLLVQLEQWERPQRIFGEYPYFSSFSDSWLQHAEAYVGAMISRFELNEHNQVIEIGSNDGYLLQYFLEHGVPVLGIEPAHNVARVASARGIRTLRRFFGERTAQKLASRCIQADLLIGNNVLAHVPNLNEFVRGLKIGLRRRGIITMEFPHLMRLMAEHQIDTIYHEHFSYFSFIAVEKIFAAHGLTIFDVEELPTHGGSLRIYARHSEDVSRPVSVRVEQLRLREVEGGFATLECYLDFKERVHETKRKLLEFLIFAKRAGKRVVAYGAPAKGNTLLNFCGIRSDFIEYTVDRNPYKQGRFLPGTHIPIHHPEKIKELRPDYLLILPWNLKDEIIEQMSFIRTWGARFVVPIPKTQVIA